MPLPTVFRLLLVAWLVYIAVYDWRTWTVPGWTTWPVVIAAGLGHAGLGAWVPLVLLALYYLWDTTVGDLKRLLRWRFSDTERDDRRWLVPDVLAFALTLVLLAVARSQGAAAFFFTAGFALVHLLWRLNRLPGGDAALLIALLALFPSLRFLVLASIVVAALVLPRLAWRYRHDLVAAAHTGLTAGPWAALTRLRTAAQRKSQPEPVAYLFSLAGIAAVVWL
jgi:Flp pilus assembly protein protease CpaA